jgi:hypothetical protein
MLNSQTVHVLLCDIFADVQLHQPIKEAHLSVVPIGPVVSVLTGSDLRTSSHTCRNAQCSLVDDGITMFAIGPIPCAQAGAAAAVGCSRAFGAPGRYDAQGTWLATQAYASSCSCASACHDVRRPWCLHMLQNACACITRSRRMLTHMASSKVRGEWRTFGVLWHLRYAPTYVARQAATLDIAHPVPNADSERSLSPHADKPRVPAAFKCIRNRECCIVALISNSGMHSHCNGDPVATAAHEPLHPASLAWTPRMIELSGQFQALQFQCTHVNDAFDVTSQGAVQCHEFATWRKQRRGMFQRNCLDRTVMSSGSHKPF